MEFHKKCGGFHYTGNFPMELVWFLGLEDIGVFVHNALYANFIGFFLWSKKNGNFTLFQ
jgi:hypothetical protein